MAAFVCPEVISPFELRSFHTPGLEGVHVSRIVRFGPDRGIYAAGEVMMQDFQVHEMDDPERQYESSREGPAPGELGRSQPGVVRLESADPEYKYQLVLSRSEIRIKGGVENYRKAELVQTDPGGRISLRVLLYQDQFAEYGD